MLATRGIFKGLNTPMALAAYLIVGVFLAFGALFPSLADQVFSLTSGWIISHFKWFYILIVAFFLLFAIGLLFTRFGDLKLGDDDQQPEFGYFSWFSMLFGAGMGIGLIFWSIAEPVYHYMGNPLDDAAGTADNAVTAMRLTYFHWGLHPWAIYSIVGLSLAFFTYRKKLPLSIRSVLYPVIGERIYGPIGHAVDVLAVFGTIFGVATSLGLGVTQINTGLNELTGLAISTTNQMILIAVITLIATGSVVSGVGKGVRILSELNLYLSFSILAFFIALGPTIYLLESFVQGLGDYLQNVLALSFWTNATDTGETDWHAAWTAFYWAWWIAWAPFVGMFIARISRGRTIREFVLGVLLVPALLAMVWLTAFGGTGMWLELFGAGGLVEAVNASETRALYFTIEAVSPGLIGTIMAVIATTLIATYFITSSDSGTLVITTLLSLGDREPHTGQRVAWGLGEGLVAAVLLGVGGLGALQSAAIIAALPFSIIMLFMCYALIIGLRDERRLMLYAERRNRAPGERLPGG